jgi:hypothetical protein
MWDHQLLTILWASMACYWHSFTSLLLEILSLIFIIQNMNSFTIIPEYCLGTRPTLPSSLFFYLWFLVSLEHNTSILCRTKCKTITAVHQFMLHAMKKFVRFSPAYCRYCWCTEARSVAWMEPTGPHNTGIAFSLSENNCSILGLHLLADKPSVKLG